MAQHPSKAPSGSLPLVAFSFVLSLCLSSPGGKTEYKTIPQEAAAACASPGESDKAAANKAAIAREEAIPGMVRGDTAISCTLVSLHVPPSSPPTSANCRKALPCLCSCFCRNGLQFCRLRRFCRNGQRFRCLHDLCPTCECSPNRKPRREQGCASPGESAGSRPPLTATMPQAAVAAAATADSRDSSGRDTSSRHRQTADLSPALAIIGDSTAGVNAQAWPVRLPRAGCSEEAEERTRTVPPPGSVQSCVCLSRPQGRKQWPQQWQPQQQQQQQQQRHQQQTQRHKQLRQQTLPLPWPLLEIPHPGVNSKGGKCASPEGECSEGAEERTRLCLLRGVCSLVPASHGNSAASSGSNSGSSNGSRAAAAGAEAQVLRPASVRPRWGLPRAAR